MITSVSEAIDSVKFTSIKGEFLFRGQANSKWSLTPSLFRRFPKKEFAVILERFLCTPLLEGKLLPYSHDFNPINHLMILQHFGVPTRFLDWTLDVHLALFFACYDESGSNNDFNGRLFTVDRSSYNHLTFNNETDTFSQKLDKENYHLIAEKLATKDIHLLDPLIQNPRMRVQNGCFMFFPFSTVNKDRTYLDLIEYNRALDQWISNDNIERNPTLLRHKDVSKESKKSILEELDRKHGISKSTVFVEIDEMKKARKIYTQLFFEASAKTNKYLKGLR